MLTQPYGRGVTAACVKLGVATESLAKLMASHAVIGGLGGLLPGAIGGAIAAPDGMGWRGAGYGALSGSLTGAAIGAGGRAIRGRTMMARPNMTPEQRLTAPALETGSHLAAGLTGALVGPVAGAWAAPEKPKLTVLDKLKLLFTADK